MAELNRDMTPLEPHDLAAGPGEGAPVGYCRYCGATLSGFFYFCVSCGTPFRAIDTVVSAPLPPYLSESALIRQKAPSVFPLFWSYLGALVGAAVMAELLFEEDRPDLRLLFQVVVLFVVTCVAAVMYHRSLSSQFKRFGFNRPEALLGLLALAPLMTVGYTYFWALIEAGAKHRDDLQELRATDIGEFTIIAVYCLYPAITEEIAFRGLVQHWLQVAIKPWQALVLASFLFTVLHFSVLSFPYLFAVGMLLGWTKWKTQSLYPSMLIHFLHNLIVIEFFG